LTTENPPEAEQQATTSESTVGDHASKPEEDSIFTPATSARETRPAAVQSDSEADEAKEAAAGKGPVKPPKPPIESIEDLLKEAYESKAHVLSFATDKLKKLPVTDDQIKSQAQVVASFAQGDPTLSGPFKLLQYVASRGVPLDRRSGAPLEGVLERLRDLALLALGQHPVFRVWSDELGDPRRTPELTVVVVRDEVQKVSAETLGVPVDQFKRSDKERLLRNAIACLSLVRALQRDWNLDRFIDEYHAAIWSVEAPKAISPQKAAGLLSASRDANLLGLVAEAYEARVSVRDQEIQRLKREASLAANREARLSDDLREARVREETLTARAEAFSADIVRLQKELAAERDNRVVDKSHMANDYETLRTRVIRRLSGEIDLLTDALHALRNGASPVAEEFLDRSLLALSREVEQLKDAAGGLA
jgi:hypothetical protein